MEDVTKSRDSATVGSSRKLGTRSHFVARRRSSASASASTAFGSVALYACGSVLLFLSSPPPTALLTSSAIRVFDWDDVIAEAQTDLCPGGMALCSARENLSATQDVFNATLLSPNEMSPATFGMSPCFCDYDCLKYGDCCVDFAAKNWGNGDEEFSEYYVCLPLQDERLNVLSGKRKRVRGKAENVYMVGKCPRSYRGSEDVEAKCLRSGSIPDREYSHFLDLPAHSAATGRTYVNLFCAVCHGEDIRSLVRWNMTVACATNVTGYAPEEFMKGAEYKRGERSWTKRIWNDTNSNTMEQAVYCHLRVREFENATDFMSNFQARRCKPHMRDTCSPEWLERASAADEELAAAAQLHCGLYRMSVRVANLVTFRNVHCAVCNGVELNASSTSGGSRVSCDAAPTMMRSGVPHHSFGFGYIPSFSVIFDFSGDGSSGVGLADRCDEETEVWDDVHQRCHAVRCGRMFKNVDGKCVKRPSQNLERILQSQQSANGNDTYVLTADCFTIDVHNGEFDILDNDTLYVNRTRQLRAPGEYELINETSVRICASKSAQNDDEYFKFSASQAYFSFACLTLSLVGLAAHIFIYWVVPKLRNLPGKNLLALASCLFVAQILFLTGIGGNDSKEFCVFLALTMHYFFLASFMWMNVMSFDVFKTFNKTTYHPDRKTKLFRIYSAYAWGVPAVVIAFAVSADFTDMAPEYAPLYAQPLCWFNNRKGLAILFVLPVGAVIFENVILFALSAYGIYKQQEAAKMASKSVRSRGGSERSNKLAVQQSGSLIAEGSAKLLRKKQTLEQQQRKNRVRFVLYLKLAVIMGLGWIFGFVAGFADVPWLWYVFFFFNGMQGVMIFVAFDLKKTVISMVVERLTGRPVKAWQTNATDSKGSKTTTTTTTASGRRVTSQSSASLRSTNLVQPSASAKNSVVVVAVPPPPEIADETEPMLRRQQNNRTSRRAGADGDGRGPSSIAVVAKIRPTSRGPEKPDNNGTPDSAVSERPSPTAPPAKPSRKTSKTLSFHGDVDIFERERLMNKDGDFVTEREDPKFEPISPRTKAPQDGFIASAARRTQNRPHLKRPDSLPVDLETLSAHLIRQKAREVLASKLAAMEKERQMREDFVLTKSESEGNIMPGKADAAGVPNFGGKSAAATTLRRPDKSAQPQPQQHRGRHSKSDDVVLDRRNEAAVEGFRPPRYSRAVSMQDGAAEEPVARLSRAVADENGGGNNSPVSVKGGRGGSDERRPDIGGARRIPGNAGESPGNAAKSHETRVGAKNRKK